SWWFYHGFMLAGFLIAVLVLLSEFFRGRGVISIMRGLFVLEGIVELELEHQETIAALAAATEAKDPYTHGHTIRVAQQAVRIGRAMDLPPERLRVLARAGLLHDVGKLGIRDAVLLKPDKLTPEEFRHIQEHPKLGHDILRRVGSLEAEISVIVAHHERMDGTGYPSGLQAEAIPLEARILAVADVFDALTSKRPYRDPMSEEEALDVIQSERGTHFDPACIDAFVQSKTTGRTPGESVLRRCSKID
ncbi:MAG TPA: HD-GYP domain-containing protein, partial [Dehalococcoidia bacterium]|nr:HD-GYP domain-containing protein [Dehalococcoidia bacterium]